MLLETGHMSIVMKDKSMSTEVRKSEELYLCYWKQNSRYYEQKIHLPIASIRVGYHKYQFGFHEQQVDEFDRYGTELVFRQPGELSD